MFGNTRLPNISPSHLFHLPPPSHNPAVVDVPAVPLANAQMGQARALLSNPTATSLPPTAYATSPPSTTARRYLTTTANHGRHVTAANDRVCHLTVINNPQTHLTDAAGPQTPRHRRQMTVPRHNGCPSPPRGMWAPKSTRRNEEERGGWERESGSEGWGICRQGETVGEGGGRLCPPFPCIFVLEANETA
jgi:hypothetical protein